MSCLVTEPLKLILQPIIFSIIPVVAKMITGMYTLKQQLIFLAVMYIYTLSYLFYQCKISSTTKKSVNFKKALAATMPMLIYVAIVIALNQLVLRSFNPYLMLFFTLFSSGFGIFVVSFYFYYPAVRLSHSECWPNIFKSIWDMLVKIVKCIIPGL
jgi:hypothetical protein